MSKSPKHDTTAPGRSPLPFIAGLLALLVAVAASGMLVAQHFGGLTLPGCGPNSGCAKAAASVWGKVPLPGGMQWPVSFVGLAYFIAVMVAWIVAVGRTSSLLRWLVRLGALASVGFLVVMVSGGYLCQYCAVAHVANLIFWIIVEASGRRTADQPAVAPASGLVTVAGLFVAASVVMLVLDRSGRAQAEEQAEEALERSQAEILSAPKEAEPFTGRWRQGPEQAPVRIVLFSDFQCPDCYRIEKEIQALQADYPEISVSAKHFPMCKDCNKYMSGANPHPNACWAARAAETAGLLYGNEGFWKMHHWLFEKEGSFTNAELPGALEALGFEPVEFQRVMQTQEVLDPVLADIDQAKALGLHFTPMIFINGVELTGWNARDAVRRAVEPVLQSSPPPLAADADRPQQAHEKYISDWVEKRPRSLGHAGNKWARGPENAKARVVIWADLQSKTTANIDRELRALVEQRDDTSYRLLHYPMNQACNPASKRTITAHSCATAQAAEAAGVLGGADAYWGMIDWILANQDRFADAAAPAESIVNVLVTAAIELGLDGAQFRKTMFSTEVSQAIATDAQVAQRLGARFLPLVYVDEKWVPRWSLQGHPIMQRIVEKAALDD